MSGEFVMVPLPKRTQKDPKGVFMANCWKERLAYAQLENCQRVQIVEPYVMRLPWSREIRVSHQHIGRRVSGFKCWFGLHHICHIWWMFWMNTRGTNGHVKRKTPRMFDWSPSVSIKGPFAGQRFKVLRQKNLTESQNQGEQTPISVCGRHVFLHMYIHIYKVFYIKKSRKNFVTLQLTTPDYNWQHNTEPMRPMVPKATKRTPPPTRTSTRHWKL